MAKEVHAALISGPTYDPLYERLEAFTTETGIEVRIGFTGSHPALNRHLAACSGAPYDLISTHSKYAPSQMGFLAPLDEVLDENELLDFEPHLLDLARIDGQLFGVPRLVDVRLLHFRTDLMEEPPATWDGLLNVARALKAEKGCYGFAFPGRGSGLFGTFYELAEMGGARLFPDGDLVPAIENDGGAWALGLLRTLYEEEVVPRAVPDWHFDEVHHAFRDGTVAMIGDWPGFYELHSDAAISQVADRFSVCPYPIGPGGASLAYGGEHTFGLTRGGLEKPEAAALLKFLVAPAQQSLEARNGSMPPRRSVMRRIQSEARGARLKRWQALEQIVTKHILIPPKLACYPQVETIIWQAVQQAVTGKLGVREALAHITRQTRSTLEAYCPAPSG